MQKCHVCVLVRSLYVIQLSVLKACFASERLIYAPTKFENVKQRLDRAEVMALEELSVQRRLSVRTALSFYTVIDCHGRSFLRVSYRNFDVESL